MSSPRANLAVALTAAGLLALLPRPGLKFVGYFHEPFVFLLAPIQQPARTVAVWLGGGGRGGPERPSGLAGTSTDVARLEANLQEARLELLQSRGEADNLRALVHDLSRGMELNPTLAVRQITAPVIGFGADLSGGLMTVRAGRQEGVDTNAVVVVRGVYLVGRVQKAEERTCSVLPITDPAFARMFKSQKFSGVIMLDDQRRGPAWQLESIEDGKLIGKVWDIKGSDGVAAGGERPMILPDMLVRLADDKWPASAQMLVIGRIERVEPIANDRLVVTIKPLQDITHVSEVMIRVADTAPSTPTGAEKGAKSKP